MDCSLTQSDLRNGHVIVRLIGFTFCCDCADFLYTDKLSLHLHFRVSKAHKEPSNVFLKIIKKNYRSIFKNCSTLVHHRYQFLKNFHLIPFTLFGRIVQLYHHFLFFLLFYSEEASTCGGKTEDQAHGWH